MNRIITQSSELIKLSKNAAGSIFCTAAAMDQIAKLDRQARLLKHTNSDLLSKHSPEDVLNWLSEN